MAVVAGVGSELLGHADRPPELVARKVIASAADVVSVEDVVFFIPAGEQALTERRVGQHTDALLLAERQDFLLYLAGEQVVLGLPRSESTCRTCKHSCICSTEKLETPA